jgi:hypothetical protein
LVFYCSTLFIKVQTEYFGENKCDIHSMMRTTQHCQNSG